MDGPPPIPPSPPLPAAEPVPAGVLCIRCRYDLAGLDRAGVCPECGHGVADAIARWDRRARESPRDRRARGDARAMLWIAVWLLAVPTLAAANGVGLAMKAAIDPHFTAGYAGQVIAVNILFWSSVAIAMLLVMLLILWYRLGNPEDGGPDRGAAERAWLRASCAVLGLALSFAWVCAFLFVWKSVNEAVALGAAGLVVAFIAAILLCRSGGRHAARILPRCGPDAWESLGEWPATALAVGGVVLVPVGTWGVFAWWLAALAALAGLVVLACALAVRCVRVICALDRSVTRSE